LFERVELDAGGQEGVDSEGVDDDDCEGQEGVDDDCEGVDDDDDCEG